MMVTADELTQIHGRMAEAGISNAGAYMRKMAINGYILHVDLAPVRGICFTKPIREPSALTVL